MAPDVPLLVFDGDCGFCTAAAGWIAARWPAAGGPRAVPWQGLSPDTLPDAGLTRMDVDRAAWWIAEGRPEAGARAVGRALVAAGGPWGVVGHLLLVAPLSWVAGPVYRLVARHRHRLPGATPACRV